MNRFDPPPDLGNANVGNIDKLLMRAYPYEVPVFLCDKPGKRLPCSHGQTFAGQRTASSEAESWGVSRADRGEPLSDCSLEHPNERWKYDERISGKCKKYSTAGT